MCVGVCVVCVYVCGCHSTLFTTEYNFLIIVSSHWGRGAFNGHVYGYN